MTKTLLELAESEVSSVLHSPGGIFSPGDPVSKVLGVLKDTRRLEAVAAEGARVGVVTVRGLLGVDQPNRTKVESIWQQTGAVYPGTTVIEAVEILLEKGVRALPVLDGNRVVGIVSQVDITEAMTDVPELRNTAAKDVMQNPVITVGSTVALAQARRIMLDEDISHLPVTRDGRLVGMVTAKDIVHTFIAPASRTTRGELVGEKGTRFPGQVSGVMDKQPYTEDTDADALRVVMGLAKSGKSACLIVDERKTVHGIVTPRELMPLIAGLRGEEVVPVYIVGITEEDFFERAVAEEKLRRTVMRSMRMYSRITEVSVRVKKQRARGERTRYSVTARAVGPTVEFNAENEGWGLMETFDGLCDALDNVMRRAKKEPQKGARRGRRRPGPHLKP